MAEPSPLHALQRSFAAHIRDPEGAPAPAGIEDRRMAIYRDLFFNNIEAFLAGALPVLHGLLDRPAWLALMRDFYARHRAGSPFFRDLPREFLRYLDEQRGNRRGDPPFLRELAHYEWVELALAGHEDCAVPAGIAPGGDLLDGHPLPSPLAWGLCYRFPVHRIGPDCRPAEPPAEPTHLLAWRDARDEVRVLELNAVSARLFALLRAHADDPQFTGSQALERIAAELRHPQPDQVRRGGLETLEDWRGRGIVLGTLNAGRR